MKLPITYIKLNDTIGGAMVALKKSGDIAKGEQVYPTMITKAGKMAVCRRDGEASEHWHDMESFVWFADPIKFTPANDNGE